MARVVATAVVVGMLSGPEPVTPVHTQGARVPVVVLGPGPGPPDVLSLPLENVGGPVTPDPPADDRDDGATTFNVTVAFPEPEPEPSPPAAAPVPAALPPVPAAGGSSLQPCGGDYPPCYVADRESHGSYAAYNPTGCTSNGRSGCYGKWQFGWFWGGKLGLPDDLALATPAQQDEAARLLWNGGRGCSNWAAC